MHGTAQLQAALPVLAAPLQLVAPEVEHAAVPTRPVETARIQPSWYSGAAGASLPDAADAHVLSDRFGNLPKHAWLYHIFFTTRQTMIVERLASSERNMVKPSMSVRTIRWYPMIRILSLVTPLRVSLEALVGNLP